jgi:IS5 family transposase
MARGPPAGLQKLLKEQERRQRLAADAAYSEDDDENQGKVQC